MKNLLKLLGERKIAYVILATITEPEETYLIVNKKEKEYVNRIIEKIWDTYMPYRNDLKALKLSKVNILNEEEYYMNWKNYIGERILYLEDSNFRWSVLESLGNYIRYYLKKNTPLELVLAKIIEVVHTIDEILIKQQESAVEIITQKFEDKKLINFAQKLLEYLQRKIILQ